MIKFFRNIRKKLLIEDHTSKYIKYAIGEIVLVVIGILIALQVNDWNENLKKTNLETYYLNELKQEFTDNIKELERSMNSNNSNTSNALELSNLLASNRETLTEEKFNYLLFNSIISEVQYRPSPGTLYEMVNTGKLEIISNKKLRSKLSSWDAILLKARFQENEHATPRLKLLDLVYSEGNFRNGFLDTDYNNFNLKSRFSKKSNLDLVHSQEFDNLITVFYLTGLYLNTKYYAALNEYIKETLSLIDEELKIKSHDKVL